MNYGTSHKYLLGNLIILTCTQVPIRKKTERSQSDIYVGNWMVRRACGLDEDDGGVRIAAREHHRSHHYFVVSSATHQPTTAFIIRQQVMHNGIYDHAIYFKQAILEDSRDRR
jgi:hypothetical protein